MLSSITLNIPAILVAVVVMFAFGMLWYSPLLMAKKWMELSGKKPEDCKPNPVVFLKWALLGLVEVVAIAILIGWVGASTWQEGAIVALVMAVGIGVTDQLGSILWEQKPFQLVLINSGCLVLSAMLAGAIVAGWPLF